MNKNETTEVVIAISAENIKTELAKLNITDEAIAKLNKQLTKLKISDIDDKENYELVRKGIRYVVGKRREVDGKRKELKSEVLAVGKSIDEEAKRIIELLAPIEEHLKAEKAVVDDEKERIAEEKKAELDKLVQDRAGVLMRLGMEFNGVSYDFEDFSILNAELSVINEENFNVFLEKINKRAHEIQLNALKIKELQEEREKLLAPYREFRTNTLAPSEYISLGDMTEEQFNVEFKSCVKLKQIKDEQIRIKAEEDEAAEAEAKAKEKAETKKQREIAEENNRIAEQNRKIIAEMKATSDELEAKEKALKEREERIAKEVADKIDVVEPEILRNQAGEVISKNVEVPLSESQIKEPDFLEYLYQARIDFVKVVGFKALDNDTRTAIDSLLIAYDQAVEVSAQYEGLKK